MSSTLTLIAYSQYMLKEKKEKKNHEKSHLNIMHQNNTCLCLIAKKKRKKSLQNQEIYLQNI